MLYNTVIIGAGPGGYVAAIRLGQLGKKVLVVEKEYVGGVCLNRGCVPTKALIHAAHLRTQSEYARREIGLFLKDEGFDMDRMRIWRNKIVDRLVRGVKTLWKANKVEWTEGVAQLIDNHRVKVETPKGEKGIFEGENIILASGSRPIIPPGFEPDGERVWNSNHAVSLPWVPKKLLVLGAGAIGLEFAYVYRHLGSEVEIYELMPQILPGTDTEMAKELYRALRRQGIKIFTNARALGLEKKENRVEMVVKMEGEEVKVTGDVLLIAVGRRPNYEDLNLEALGIKVNQKGFVSVDKKRQTNIPHIFAIGDLTGPPLLAHKAFKEGIVAAEVISGLPSQFEPKCIPSVVYTEPQLVSVGLTEEEAKAQGLDISIGKFPMIANGRALAYGETFGLGKILTDRSTDLVVGVHVVGPEASSLIGEGVLAIEKNATAQDIGLSIHPHPTLSEVLMEAAENVHKKAIHILNR